MDAEKLVKISRDYVPAGRRFPGRPKRRWSDLNLDYGRRREEVRPKLRINGRPTKCRT